MLRTSERLTFKRCRWQWMYTYLRKLKPTEEGAALRFGDLIHQALALYYKKGAKRGPHPARSFERLYHEQAKAAADEGFNVFSDEKWVDALELGIAMMRGYVLRYAPEDEEYQVISSEQIFRVPLKQADGTPFVYVGTLDGVWESRASGLIIFKEFKTTAAISTDSLAMDEQAGGYWTFAPKWLRRKGILKPGQTIDHILYTFMRKALPDTTRARNELGQALNKPSKAALVDRFNGKSWWHPKMTVDEMIEKGGDEALSLGEVSKNQPAALFLRHPVYRDQADRENVHQRVQAEMRDITECEEDPTRIYKNPGTIFMPNCRFCAVKDICELHETGQDYEAMTVATMKPWDPYAAHELPERY